MEVAPRSQDSVHVFAFERRRRLTSGYSWVAVIVAVAVAVTVLATPAATAAGLQAAGETPGDWFGDDDGSVHEPGLNALAARGYLARTECGDLGLPRPSICPRQPLKRWELAVWLGRALSDGDPGATATGRFADVDAGQWWASHVERFADLGITVGCAQEPLRYCPDRPVTRAAMATFLSRAFGLRGAAPAGFADTAGSVHEDAIDALAAAGITAGCESEPLRFCPSRPVTRAEMATLLARALGLVPAGPAAVSPPPTWIFAGDIPEEHQTVLRDEMEAVRAFFSDRFGVEATGFTVLAGTDHESLSAIYRDAVGRDVTDIYSEWRGDVYGWVTNSTTGGSIVTLVYGGIPNDDRLDTLRHIVVHEYFHVLQGQLASGFVQLQDSEISWDIDIFRSVPTWLVEGLASYADYAYSSSTAGRREFLGDRYTPYVDIAQYQAAGSDLSIEDWGSGTRTDYLSGGCSFHSIYLYALAFAGSAYLLEQAEEAAYVNFWRLLGEKPTWQQAFSEAFGIDPSDFFEAFDKWLPSQVSPLVQLEIEVRWPNMENDPLGREIFLIAIEDWPRRDWEQAPVQFSTASTGWFGNEDLPTLTFSYDEGAIGREYLSLWWYDRGECTGQLVGWYKDGELVSRREDSTAVDFTGQSSTIVWNLPRRPDSLPVLDQRGGCECPLCWIGNFRLFG